LLLGLRDRRQQLGATAVCHDVIRRPPIEVGKKVDDLRARLGARIDAVDAKIDTVDAKVDTRSCQTWDVSSPSISRQTSSISRPFTFGEMRSFVTESIGSLRTDMLARFEGADHRFDRMDRRFDRIEDELDRALPHRPHTPRRRRKR
jgi:hypothetical protein